MKQKVRRDSPCKAAVLQLADFAAAYPGSFFNSLAALEKKLEECNFRTVYVLPERAREREWVRKELENGRKIFFLPCNPFSAAVLLHRIIRRENVKIVHTHFVHSRIFCALRLARVLNPKPDVFVHLRSIQKSANHGKIYSALRRMVISPAAYICVSRGAAEQNGAQGCVEILGNAIEFSRLEKVQELNKADFLAPGSEYAVMMFGYNIFVKGVDTAIKALECFDSQHKITLLVVASKDEEKTRGELAEILGTLPDWVRVLPQRDDIGTYYRLADAFLAASRTEGFSNALVEAAYMGLPLAAADIPGQNELCIPGTVEFAAENTGELYSALMQVLGRTAEQNAAVAAEQKDYVTRKFNLDQWCKGIISFYSKRGRTKIEQSSK